MPLNFRAVGPISQQSVSFLVPASSTDISVDDHGVGMVTDHPLYSRETLVIWKDDDARTAEVRWVSATSAGFRAGAFIV